MNRISIPRLPRVCPTCKRPYSPTEPERCACMLEPLIDRLELIGKPEDFEHSVPDNGATDVVYKPLRRRALVEAAQQLARLVFAADLLCPDDLGFSTPDLIENLEPDGCARCGQRESCTCELVSGWSFLFGAWRGVTARHHIDGRMVLPICLARSTGIHELARSYWFMLQVTTDAVREDDERATLRSAQGQSA